MKTEAIYTIVAELHREMNFETAKAWFNGILSGDEWGKHDSVEVIGDDGSRTLDMTVWGTRWTLSITVAESITLGGTTISAQIIDPVDGFEMPEFSDLARALVP